MKRNWRASRIILGVLLLSLAGVAFYVWPRGPRWSIDAEQPLGFDLQRGMLFTTTRLDKEEYELHGFDLVTGDRKVSIPFSREAKEPEELFEVQVNLSSDCSKMACWGVSEPSIKVFDVRKQGLLLFKIRNDPLMFVNFVGFSSPDGELLAFRCLGETEEVQIWDCTKGELKQTLKMPEGTTSGGGIRPQKELTFSGDGRYLAVGCDDTSVIVFDLSSGREAGRCLGARRTVFLSDNGTLVTLPGFYSVHQIRIFYLIVDDVYSTNHIHWYQISADNVTQLPKSSYAVWEKAYLLDANPAILLTYDLDDSIKRQLPSWIPVGLRDKLEEVLGWKKDTLVIRSCDIYTGVVRQEYKIQVKGLSEAKVSPDGFLLALKEYDSLSLWDILPHRSITCWLVCSSLALFALWLGYPRRAKMMRKES